jgi:hypothetical protein
LAPLSVTAAYIGYSPGAAEKTINAASGFTAAFSRNAALGVNEQWVAEAHHVGGAEPPPESPEDAQPPRFSRVCALAKVLHLGGA